MSNLSIVTRSLVAPPNSPQEGDYYIVGSPATGAWATHEAALAWIEGGTWNFTSPTESQEVYILDEDTELTYEGSAWVAPLVKWTHVANTPTTLAGYGITDALTVSQLGGASGIATLDETGHVPLGELPYTQSLTGDIQGTLLPSSTIKVRGIQGKALATPTNDKTLLQYKSSSLQWVSPASIGFPFSSINTLPTTLSGYGITDAAPLSNPTFTGAVRAETPDPSVNSTIVATTAYVTSALSTITGGGIVHIAGDETVAGYKRFTSPVMMDKGFGFNLTYVAAAGQVAEHYTYTNSGYVGLGAFDVSTGNFTFGIGVPGQRGPAIGTYQIYQVTMNPQQGGGYSPLVTFSYPISAPNLSGGSPGGYLANKTYVDAAAAAVVSSATAAAVAASHTYTDQKFADAVATVVGWTDITSKPTTISGFGITDGVTSTTNLPTGSTYGVPNSDITGNFTSGFNVVGIGRVPLTLPTAPSGTVPYLLQCTAVATSGAHSFQWVARDSTFTVDYTTQVTNIPALARTDQTATFTVSPIVPTPDFSDNSTKAATTEFVQNLFTTFLAAIPGGESIDLTAFVSSNGASTITGTKTFTAGINTNTLDSGDIHSATFKSATGNTAFTVSNSGVVTFSAPISGADPVSSGQFATMGWTETLIANTVGNNQVEWANVLSKPTVLSTPIHTVSGGFVVSNPLVQTGSTEYPAYPSQVYSYNLPADQAVPFNTPTGRWSLSVHHVNVNGSPTASVVWSQNDSFLAFTNPNSGGDHNPGMGWIDFPSTPDSKSTFTTPTSEHRHGAWALTVNYEGTRSYSSPGTLAYGQLLPKPALAWTDMETFGADWNYLKNLTYHDPILGSGNAMSGQWVLSHTYSGTYDSNKTLAQQKTLAWIDFSTILTTSSSVSGDVTGALGTTQVVGLRGYSLPSPSSATDDVVLKYLSGTHTLVWQKVTDLSHAWSDITNKPDTLDGYGITDGLTTSTQFSGDVSGTASTLSVTQVQGKFFVAPTVDNAGSYLKYDEVNDIYTWGAPGTTEFLALSGGTLTGALTLSGNPSSNLQAAPKQYVDLRATQSDFTAHTGNTTNPHGLTIANILLKADLGTASGPASLNSNGKIPTSQLPDSIVGALQYQGVWNASANSPALASGVGTKGNFYKVSVSGTTTIDGCSQWAVGDWIVFDGTTWDLIDNTESVTSVAGRTGTITLAVGDISGAVASTSIGANSGVAGLDSTGHVPIATFDAPLQLWVGDLVLSDGVF